MSSFGNLFGQTTPPPSDGTVSPVPDPGQVFTPFDATTSPVPIAAQPVESVQLDEQPHLNPDIEVITQHQQVQPPVLSPAPIPPSTPTAPYIPPPIQSAETDSASFPKQVTSQVEAMLQKSIEEEQQAIDLERDTLQAKRSTIETQKAQLEQLRQNISTQETAIQEQENELAQRTSQVEGRELRVAKVMEALES